jgi:homoserine dehydrogenase
MHPELRLTSTELDLQPGAAAHPASPSREPLDLPVTVLKFGSSFLKGDPSMSNVVVEIYRELRRGRRVFAVVSAFPGHTDGLRKSADRRFASPDPACLASLLATGETASAALLGMALEDAGIPAAVLDPVRAGFRVEGSPLDATPVSLDARRIRRIFRTRSVVVFPGFFGRLPDGSTALLGRGGSDFTAIYCAHALRAGTCRLVKDVDGIYSGDPKGASRPQRYERLGWEDAAAVAGRSVQPRALQFARRHGIEFEVGSGAPECCTIVGSGPSRAGAAAERTRPLRVALFGLGAVGRDLLRRLRANPDLFEVVGAAVRDPGKPRDPGLPRELLHLDPQSLLREPADAVVELMGGLEPATSVISAALESGRDVVTANKAVLARHGRELERLAASRGRTLSFAACVGGGVPVLETLGALAAHKRVERLSAVLNGTCNYVLDRLAEGIETAEAIREAQALGYAEADPTLDLSGDDSADKLRVLARAVFGHHLDTSAFKVRGIDASTAQAVRAARERGSAVRLVASISRTSEGIRAAVRPLELPAGHPLAGTCGAENRVVAVVGGRTVVLRGRGAGGKATSLSVFADLLDLRCASQAPGLRLAPGPGVRG